MARDNSGFYCKGSCHKFKTMQSYEIHHVWPQEFHGPTVETNLVKICCNCHSNTHDLLNKMLRSKPYDLNSYSVTEQRLAKRGYKEVMKYSESLVN